MLALSHVQKQFRSPNGPIQILRDVSLSVRPGEFVSVIGASGSGKSTLLNIAGCLDKPTAGTVSVNGTATDRLSETDSAALRNREIGFIFQAYHLLPTLTALENVALPLRYRGFSRKKATALAAEALARVGLAHRADYFPVQLSGGQQQRAAIARALIGKPSVLLADEPTGNLDPATGQEMLGLLQEACKGGSALLLITHDTQIAAAADSVFRLKEGCLEPISDPHFSKIVHIV